MHLNDAQNDQPTRYQGPTGCVDRHAKYMSRRCTEGLKTSSHDARSASNLPARSRLRSNNNVNSNSNSNSNSNNNDRSHSCVSELTYRAGPSWPLSARQEDSSPCKRRRTAVPVFRSQSRNGCETRINGAAGDRRVDMNTPRLSSTGDDLAPANPNPVRVRQHVELGELESIGARVYRHVLDACVCRVCTVFVSAPPFHHNHATASTGRECGRRRSGCTRTCGEYTRFQATRMASLAVSLALQLRCSCCILNAASLMVRNGRSSSFPSRSGLVQVTFRADSSEKRHWLRSTGKRIGSGRA